MRRRSAALAVAAAVALAVAIGVLVTGGDDGGTTARSGPDGPPPVRIGDWRHVADPENTGLDAGWPRDPPPMEPVAVPGVPEARVIGGEAGRESFAGAVEWWGATLTVPEPGRYAVRFGSVGHDATVWVDGHEACEHTGAYEPFDCRVRLTSPGDHEVMLRADWRDLEQQAREGWDRAWWNWGGPSWEVTARRLADVEVALVGVETRLREDGSARVTLDIELRDTRGEIPGTRDVPRRVDGVLRHAGESIPITVPATPVPRGGAVRVEARLTIEDPELWSPPSPALHALRLRTNGGGTLTRRIGLREVVADGTRLLVNGEPFRLVGAGLPPDARGHGDALTANDRRRIIDELRAIGANAVRSQHPLSEAFLSELDAAGIFVWQLIGPFDKAGKFWAQTPERREEATARALRTVDREAAHPSILAWTLANEVAGSGHPKGQATYIDELAQELNDRTPGILVAADIWGLHPPREASRLYRSLDAVGFTEYIGIAELAGAPAAAQEKLLAERIGRVRALLPDTLLVITEFGANANGANPHDAAGGYGYQAALLRRRIAYYRERDDIAGMLIWILRDYAVSHGFSGGNLGERLPDLELSGPLSEKGLFRYDGTAKPAVEVVREAFAEVDGAPAAGG